MYCSIRFGDLYVPPGSLTVDMSTFYCLICICVFAGIFFCIYLFARFLSSALIKKYQRNSLLSISTQKVYDTTGCKSNERTSKLLGEVQYSIALREGL